MKSRIAISLSAIAEEIQPFEAEGGRSSWWCRSITGERKPQ